MRRYKFPFVTELVLDTSTTYHSVWLLVTLKQFPSLRKANVVLRKWMHPITFPKNVITLPDVQELNISMLNTSFPTPSTTLFVPSVPSAHIALRPSIWGSNTAPSPLSRRGVLRPPPGLHSTPLTASPHRGFIPRTHFSKHFASNSKIPCGDIGELRSHWKDKLGRSPS